MFAPEFLPSNATAFERALSLTGDQLARLGPYVDAIGGSKFQVPAPASYAAALKAEWGLDFLAAFVPDDTTLFTSGVKFYRIRGTPKALTDGFAMLGYAGTLEEAPQRWKKWTNFSYGFTTVRANEYPDLPRLAGLGQFAVAERSRFWRGFSGYDFRAAEFARHKFASSIYGDDSGNRVPTNPVLWSYGRNYSFDVTLSVADTHELGLWISPVQPQAPSSWRQAWWPWSLWQTPWNATSLADRLKLVAYGITSKPCWFEFKNSAGTVIGYRKARANLTVAPNVAGKYTVNGIAYKETDFTSTVLVECLTDFDDFRGQTATSVGLRFDATPIGMERYGLRMADNNDLDLPRDPIAVQTINIPFGRTVRERVTMLLRVTN
jgi:hypothetical protein